MLATRLDEIDELLLDQVCGEQWDESSTLEFKAVLPLTLSDDKPKQEFLKDVAALANSSGGDIVYGIGESAGKATAKRPISLADHPVDATRRRLGQWLESGVEPRISGIEMHPVMLASGGYILVIRVPTSFQGPHRSKIGAHWQWPVRSGTHTADLSYSQIKDAFDRGATLGERGRSFRDRRLTAILSNTTGRPLQSGPRCVVHLIPMAALAGRVTVNLKELYPGPYAQFMGFGWGGATRLLNLDGLVIYPGGANADKLVYTQIFRDGCMEAVRFAGALLDDKPMAMPSGVVSGHVRESLEKFLVAAKSWGIEGPAIAAAALLDIHGWQFAFQSRAYFNTYNSADRPHLILPEVWIDDLASTQVDTVAKPLLDTLWQAFDLLACGFYDAQGKWALF